MYKHILLPVAFDHEPDMTRAQAEGFYEVHRERPFFGELTEFMSRGPIVVMALIFVLHEAYVLGSEKLPAPQGQALASMVTGIMGGDVPAEKYLAGAGLGALLSIFQPGLGITVGLGFYLPFNIVLTYSLGTALRVISDYKLGHAYAENTGIPVTAGFIVGEALVGVGYAISMIIKAV